MTSEGSEFVEHELLWPDQSFLNFSSIPLGRVWKDEIGYPSDRRGLLWRSFSELHGRHIRSHSQFSCRLILLKHLFLPKLISTTMSGQLSSHKHSNYTYICPGHVCSQRNVKTRFWVSYSTIHKVYIWKARKQKPDLYIGRLKFIN